MVGAFFMAVCLLLLIIMIKMGQEKHGCPDCAAGYEEVFREGHGVVTAKTGRCARYPACQDQPREGADLDLEDEFAEEIGLSYFYDAPKEPPHQS